jgi:hypothetical protein
MISEAEAILSQTLSPCEPQVRARRAREGRPFAVGRDRPDQADGPQVEGVDETYIM